VVDEKFFRCDFKKNSLDEQLAALLILLVKWYWDPTPGAVLPK